MGRVCKKTAQNRCINEEPLSERRHCPSSVSSPSAEPDAGPPETPFRNRN
jgi:hypothetical protein